MWFFFFLSCLVFAQQEVIVSVDQTADSAKNAKEQAIEGGRLRAADILRQRLLLRVDQEKIPPQHFLPFITSFRIGNEKSSSIRYLADVTYTFEGVESFLKERHLQSARSLPKLVLVPLWKESDKEIAWHEPWSSLWQPTDEIAFSVPVEDAENQALIQAKEWEKLAARHEAQDVWVVMGEQVPEGVRITLDQNLAEPEVLTLPHPLNPLEILERMAENCKRQTPTMTDMTVPIHDLKDYADKLKSLKKTHGVIAVIPLRLKADEATLRIIHYPNDKEFMRRLHKF